MFVQDIELIKINFSFTINAADEQVYPHIQPNNQQKQYTSLSPKKKTNYLY